MPQLLIQIQKQPDDTTCGPTCLHAVYQYFDDDVSLESLIDEVLTIDSGGTLAVHLACHALRRGYRATLYTYNLQLFDPSWFEPGVDVAAKLLAQMAEKPDEKLNSATAGYLEYLRLGGVIRFEDLSEKVIQRHLSQGVPILTGLSATYLYGSKREFGSSNLVDDIRGLPVGHFVVLCGHRAAEREVQIADPLHPNPLSQQHVYSLSVDRVIGAILLGIVTYDANLLVLEPAARRESNRP